MPSNIVIVCLENHTDSSALDMMLALIKLRPEYFRTLAFELPRDLTPELYLEGTEVFFSKIVLIANIVQQRHMSADFALWSDTELALRLIELSEKYPNIEESYHCLRRLNTRKKLYEVLKERIEQPDIAIAFIDREVSFLTDLLEKGLSCEAEHIAARDQHFFDQLERLRASGNVVVTLGKFHHYGLATLAHQASVAHRYIFVNTTSYAFRMAAQPLFGEPTLELFESLITLSSPEQIAVVAQTIFQQADLLTLANNTASITSQYDSLREGAQKASVLPDATMNELPDWNPSAAI